MSTGRVVYLDLFAGLGRFPAVCGDVLVDAGALDLLVMVGGDATMAVAVLRRGYRLPLVCVRQRQARVVCLLLGRDRAPRLFQRPKELI
jgi:hypothetical protein